MLKIAIPTYITTDQFMVLASTGVDGGQNAKKKIGVKNTNEATLMARPYLPSDQRRAGRGSALGERRRQIKQPMVM